MSNTNALDSQSTAPPASVVERIATDYVAQWIAGCREFLDWHRAHLLIRDASPQDKEANERIHPWMVRTTRLIQCQMLDPAFPQPALARQVEGMLWQLQEAWVQIHNPMSDSEAEAVLAEVFPSHAA